MAKTTDQQLLQKVNALVVRVGALEIRLAALEAADVGFDARLDVLETVAPPPPPPPVDPPPPPPPPPPSPTFNLAEQINATAAGGTLTLPEQVINATSTVPKAMTIKGAGPGKTIVDAAGLRPAWGKAVFVPLVNGVLVRDMTLRGAWISAGDGANAAGIRSEPNMDTNITNVEITGCQDGILNFGGTHKVIQCYIHDNGAGNDGGGHTHEIYVSGASKSLDLLGSIVKCGPRSTHAVKSRSFVTRIVDCVITGNGDDGTWGGAVINTPDGGDLFITRTRIVRIASAGNRLFLAHASESISLGSGTVTLEDVTVEGGGSFQCNIPGTHLVIQGVCKHVGPAPGFNGFASVTGQFVPA